MSRSYYTDEDRVIAAVAGLTLAIAVGWELIAVGLAAIAAVKTHPDRPARCRTLVDCRRHLKRAHDPAKSLVLRPRVAWADRLSTRGFRRWRNLATTETDKSWLESGG